MDDLMPPAGPATVFTARCPDDLLAMVPVVLGFAPADSLVMLTFGGRQFHARLDLPRGPGQVRAATTALMVPARRSGIEAVALVCYTDDDTAARRAVKALRRACRSAHIGVVEALRAHEGRWFPLIGAPHPSGVAYDVSTHPFVAEAVLLGRVVHDSRGDLAATLEPDPAGVAEVELATPQVPATPAWVVTTLERHLADHSRLSPAEVARLVVALADGVCRDAAWLRMRRESARDEVELWVDVVRRCPAPLVGHAAAVLAFACWVAGAGALAWCAVDRARAADPDHRLALLVGDLLESATPPGEWELLRDSLRSSRSA
jgi:hypothetical protein